MKKLLTLSLMLALLVVFAGCGADSGTTPPKEGDAVKEAPEAAAPTQEEAQPADEGSAGEETADADEEESEFDDFDYSSGGSASGSPGSADK